MHKIWKYTFEGDSQLLYLSVPKDGRVVDFQCQGGRIPTIWILIEDNVELEERRFIIYGTGQEIQHLEELRYIGTAQQFSGTFVWHLFEIKREVYGAVSNTS